jgi:hypothetical protein
MKISIYHFDFTFAGHGHYKVTYTSPKTGKQWTKITDNMSLIDATKNADRPKLVHLYRLKSMCKSTY